MDVRYLRYFVVLAETENFKIASERLAISEAALARAIALLEEDLAQRLFRRQPHTVTLTRAGRVLQTSAVRILAEAEILPARLESAALGEIGHLRVGLTRSAWFNPLIPAVIHAYRGIKPGIELILSEGNSQSLYESVIRDRLDAALVRPMQLPCSRLDCHFLMDEEMALVLPPGHPLAMRPHLAVGDLRDEPFVMFSRSLNPALYDAVVGAFVQADVTLRIVQHVPHLENLVSLAAVGVVLVALALSVKSYSASIRSSVVIESMMRA